MVRLTASDFYTFYRPCPCGARVYLRDRGQEELPPGPYEQVLRKLGERHERSHLETFPEFVDVSFGMLDDREARTRKEIDQGTLVIYHGLLRTRNILGDTECEVIGEPDFLILENEGYVIRDSKISRRITEQDHPEILRQVELYGWLFQQMFGRPPLRLEVYSGTGDIVDIHYDGGTAALEVLRDILELKQRTSEPYSPVGWTKCSGCAFNHRCWPQAEKMRDVACIPGVDQGLALALREQGIQTVDDLLAAFDEASLAEFRRPRGGKTQRVGKTAEYVLRMARCWASGEEVVLQTPSVPDCPNYVMFDAEGLPPQLDELDKIYLWGLQVFGREQGEYIPAVAGFGEEGDREGWECFLANAETVFDHYGDIPFIHWHHYEGHRIDAYVERHGDRDGIAARAKDNLIDLLPICQKSVALPLASYSLKVVEKYVGYERTQDEYGGEWAMAQYIEATELQEKEERERVMDEILRYNQEDLEATWSVLQWLKWKRE